MDKEIKLYLKDYINKKLLLSDLNKLIVEIQKKIEGDAKKVRRHICKYVNIQDDILYFNFENPTWMKYKEIKQKLSDDDFGTTCSKNICSDEEVSIKPVGLMEQEQIKPIEQSIVMYQFPIENVIPNKETYKKYCLSDDNWIHEQQANDIQDIKLVDIVIKLLQIEYPPQGSEKWFQLRMERITASDGGCIVDVNEHELPYKFILKKVRGEHFETNDACYHGKKYEKIANMIYCYRKNVKVEDFGLVAHSDINILAASPDGIVGLYKLDGIHTTRFTGRMLEIKCPPKRKIKTDGEIYGEQCPKYYWVQVQLQLECCNLEECDFLQCDISEYDDREDFISDTDASEPFRSRSFGMEKGCLIQIMPLKYANDLSSGNIYENARFIHPPKIEMTPFEVDQWTIETINNIELLHQGYFMHKIIYWKLRKLHCCTIIRDRKWFAEKLPMFQKMWSYVTFLRNYKDKAEQIFKKLDEIPNTNNSKGIEVKRNKLLLELIENEFTRKKLLEQTGNKKMKNQKIK
jgi:putative phage-type endonuclease